MCFISTSLLWVTSDYFTYVDPQLEESVILVLQRPLSAYNILIRLSIVNFRASHVGNGEIWGFKYPHVSRSNRPLRPYHLPASLPQLFQDFSPRRSHRSSLKKSKSANVYCDHCHFMYSPVSSTSLTSLSCAHAKSVFVDTSNQVNHTHSTPVRQLEHRQISLTHHPTRPPVHQHNNQHIHQPTSHPILEPSQVFSNHHMSLTKIG